MKKAIVFGYDKEDAEKLYSKWCSENNIPCHIEDALLLSSKDSFSNIQKQLKGYLDIVIKNKITLVNFSKKEFFYYYYV